MPALALPNSPAAATAAAWRDVVLATAVGVLTYVVSCALVAPGPTALSFGSQWQLMSDAPYELRGQFPQRLLGPWLAHSLGLGGERFVLFTRALATLMLATICFFCRRRGATVVDAGLVALAVALTAPVQMYKQTWTGYVDPLCYTLFFAMWLAAARPVLFWALFLANLLNHELAAFLLPWAWFVRREAKGSWRVDAVAAALVLAAYGGFYLWVRAAAPQQKYDADYFFANPMFPGGTVVIVVLALTHLAVAFGPVLAVLAWHQHARGVGRERWHLWLVLGGVLAIFCIAWDWSRHANLIVLPLVLATVRFLAAGHRTWFVGLVAVGVGLMLVIPPWAVGAWPTRVLADPGRLLRTGAATGHPVTGEPMGGDLRDVVTVWLPEVAPYAVSILAILAAIWVAGALFARWRPAPAPVTADRGA